MKSLKLNQAEAEAVDIFSFEDLNDPIGLVLKSGCDISDFFEHSIFFALDFTGSEIPNISFRGSRLRECRFTEAQAEFVLARGALELEDCAIVESTQEKNGSVSFLEPKQTKKTEEAVSAYSEALRRIQECIEALSTSLDLSSGLSALEEIPNSIEKASHVERIDVSKTAIHDLSPLLHLPNLRELDAGKTKVSSLDALSETSKLEVLRLDQTPLKSMRAISRLKNLKSLNINGTNVSDVSPLANAAQLHTLDLNNSKVEDISSISSLPKLSNLLFWPK